DERGDGVELRADRLAAFGYFDLTRLHRRVLHFLRAHDCVRGNVAQEVEVTAVVRRQLARIRLRESYRVVRAVAGGPAEGFRVLKRYAVTLLAVERLWAFLAERDAGLRPRGTAAAGVEVAADPSITEILV